ncbi:2-C-methyl-D-erythritol 4-phosphate cytidylyltransferase [Chitinophaga horti]|uniref:2-C-methyl-D-erythritol 4-phosphate cytidylyltransferase n=1 Tax=Chitinophaga horti TaxID=2920382 RepID=A0ABY6J610_9BACT|nr:2-C-methyl-D-erythritol 4-phosphate cytidylyltransferase [Chitinophaga horti]UYQ93609.1 2-C-methyl-D-erythritol 4-phosphate cytidylyltransferase [Chitinophaga horti]
MTTASHQKIAIIVAGGSGQRMGTSLPKQFLELAGKPVLQHTIMAFYHAYEDMRVVLVLPDAHRGYAEKAMRLSEHFPQLTVIAGGETRFHSVKNGLATIAGPSVVFVHDGVRPLVSTALINRCYEAALQHGSAIPAIDLKDSIREVHADGNVAADRSRFKIIQTPQTFLSEVLLPAFDLPYDPLFTDEATVVERLGHKVHLVAGEERNLKITRPEDLVIAGALLD